MYAHLCHPEVDSAPDDEKDKLLQYYPQSHHTFHTRPSSPIPQKTTFTLTSPLFPAQNIYNSHHHMSNLHEGNLINYDDDECHITQLEINFRVSEQ